jgi:hypothetical protein
MQGLQTGRKKRMAKRNNGASGGNPPGWNENVIVKFQLACLPEDAASHRSSRIFFRQGQ